MKQSNVGSFMNTDNLTPMIAKGARMKHAVLRAVSFFGLCLGFCAFLLMTSIEVHSANDASNENNLPKEMRLSTKLAPSAVVIIGYGIAFYFLSLVLKSIPVGVAYAVWSGLGVVIITAIAWLLHGQKLDAWGFVGMGLIIAAFLLARSPSWKSLRRPTPW